MNAPRIVKNIPAGTYYIGDPCYVFGRDSWNKLIELTDCFEIPNVEYKDKPVIAFETNSGDGKYNGFCVDSGLIGIVDISLIEEGSTFFNENFNRRKHTVTFFKPFDFEWDNGDFHIGQQIHIYTRR